ncbi:MAG: hypothetical protein CVV64_07875 [Candidatus Wallbacteria bacterium HGW-Wallbacteria-1]|jgi:hypothetical protein|uniref:DUF1795 domain-containing protein n=1 Tax=Candidatus Wallbacteria bacterium HGW-Wallbacteria-1 TaxID=2013854 RepID=A0A2N1PR35_9BACT|nr:MAG: hypothetical protein CVV64_07875 [Candidatus Wallbacteria bacterium HGW-Wallbacteria-1]
MRFAEFPILIFIALFACLSLSTPLMAQCPAAATCNGKACNDACPATSANQQVAPVVQVIQVADQAMVAKVDAFFSPLQDNPEYYGDRKCRKRLNVSQVDSLIRYKPNFGKKIWIASHDVKDISSMENYLGKMAQEKIYKISALEIADHVAPHIKEKLKNTDIDYETWADTFEKWGRTYVDDSKGGKKRSTFVIQDYQNANFLIIRPRRGKKVCYYVAEKYQPIVDAILSYIPLVERGQDDGAIDEDSDDGAAPTSK